MKTTPIRSNKVLLAVLALLLTVFLVAGALLGLDLWERRQSAFPKRETIAQTLTHNGAEYVLRLQAQTLRGVLTV